MAGTFPRFSLKCTVLTVRCPWLALRSLSQECNERMLTIEEVSNQLKELVGAQKQWSGVVQSRPDLQDQIHRDQSTLPVKCMADSKMEALIPLGSDVTLKEKYISSLKTLRFGKLLENLDRMAVAISYKHNRDTTQSSDQTSALSIVTGLVDRIDLREKFLLPDSDIKLSGHVTWVGKSSMEVLMFMDQFRENGWKRVIDARFVMLARDPMNKAAIVYPLKPQCKKEDDLFQLGEANKKLRQDQSIQSLLKTPPTEEERLVIHDLFISTLDERSGSFTLRIKPEGTVWMEDTKLKTVIICFPQERNLYNKIFGGFLMRKALELAWANAWVYSKSRPFCVSVDDILFRKPVDVGSLLYLSSEVVYTEQTNVQVKVYAEVVHPTEGTHEMTNIFHFTFKTEVQVPKVMPKSYAEAMMYLDGKRHYAEAVQNSILLQ